MALDLNWLETALDITGDFETSGNPWEGATGNFDGQGISCGVLQWNIGQGSLQPLVRAVGHQAVLNRMPNFGGQMWTACTSPIPRGMEIVISWQTANRIKPPILAELRTLLGSPEMRNQQILSSQKLGNEALALSLRWAQDSRSAADSTIQEFCWFFDLLTQSGSMKNIWVDDVDNFIQGHSDPVDEICDWLAAQPSNAAGVKDCRRNAQLWRGSISPDSLKLFVLSYLRAGKSKETFQGLALNRRGTIAVKQGWVNGEQEDFRNRI